MVIDVIWRRLNLCKYDMRKGDLFVLGWTMRRGSLSSDLIVCGGGVCSILLLHRVAMPRDNRCMYMACLFLCLL